MTSARSCNLIGLVLREWAMRSLMRLSSAAPMRSTRAHAILNSLHFFLFREESWTTLDVLRAADLCSFPPRDIFARDYGDMAYVYLAVPNHASFGPWSATLSAPPVSRRGRKEQGTETGTRTGVQ